MEHIITIKNLTKSFKDQTVLDNVSINFEEGRIYGIIGRNGSGKTMLFKCILGLMPFSQGAITVRGRRLGKDMDVPEDIGMIIEGPGFLPGYSGYKNLLFLSLIRKKIGRMQIEKAIRDVGLDPKSRKRVGKYSMGMRQRLCIAQAIMEDPSILILDEPMNGLDNQGVHDISTLVEKLRDTGKTIILASHNQADINRLCDVVFEMDAGVLRM